MTATLRVVHLIAPVRFGGGEALLADMVGADPAVDESVVTIGSAPALAKRLAERGIECVALRDDEVGAERAGKLRETTGAVPLFRELRRTLRGIAPDVLHAHGYPPSLLGVAPAGRGLARVYTHHYERARPGTLERTALSAVFARYDALTTPADHLTATMNRFFPGLRRPFQTLRIGLADACFEGRPDPAWRAMFPPGTAVGVCVGRLIPTKNQELVVSALTEMDPTDRRRLGVLVVGSGPDEVRLRAAVDEHGLADSIRFVGQLPHERVPDLLASVDFGVFPTTTEASSVAAAEVLAAGRPIVHLEIDSMLETVGRAGIATSSDDFGRALVQMAARHRSFADAVRERQDRLRLASVRRSWTALYRDVTA